MLESVTVKTQPYALTRLSHTLAIVIVMCTATTISAKERQYPFAFDLAWQASVAVLQERGESIVHSDRSTGIITTDYRTEIQDEELRHKFSLRISTASDTTTAISASSVEDSEGKFGLSRNAEESDGTRETELLEAIAQRLDPASPGPNLSSPLCGIAFRIGGSVLRGTSYSSSEEFASVTPTAAAGALKTTLVKEGFDITSANGNSYVVKGSIGRREGVQAEFSIAPVSSGVQLTVMYKLPVGVHGHDGLVRDQLCKVFGGVGRLTRKPISSSTAITASPSPSNSQQTIEERLRQLDALYKKGLISEEEYKKKRAELIGKL